jgi:cell division protein FtsN
MARDYKNRSGHRNKSGTNGHANGLMVFAAGLVTGLCIAAVLYLLDSLPELQQLARTTPEQTMAPVPLEPATEKSAAVETESATQRPPPRFDFYTILPEMEVSIPEWETEAETRAAQVDSAAAPPPVTTDEGLYILQIGSFRQHDEADRVKARLALIGIQVEIQRVVIDGGDIWHRVRAGPFKDPADLNQARARLEENEIEFMLLRLKREDA